MEPGLIYQSDINGKLYTSIEQHHILRYLPKDNRWRMIDYDEMINSFSNNSYHQYQHGQSNDYVESSQEEVHSIRMNRFGYSYIKIDNCYLNYDAVSHLIKPDQLKQLTLYY